MASVDNEILREFRFFTVYKDGHVQLHMPRGDKIPPFEDPVTGVRSKDVTISDNPPVSARIFLPKSAAPGVKLPLLFYVHGGGFSIQSPFTKQYHDFVSTVAAEADCIAVSVEYGLFPERPIPACYEDSWTALQWVATRSDPWIAEHADLDNVFIAGDSAGGNITHTLVFRAGTVGIPGSKVVGAILVHPYFGGTEDDQMWLHMCPGNEGLGDPRLKPGVEDLQKLGCERVLVFIAEKDHLRPVAYGYVERLKASGWGGTVEVVENVGENHCFHLFEPEYEKAVELKNKFISFVKGE